MLVPSGPPVDSGSSGACCSEVLAMLNHRPSNRQGFLGVPGRIQDRIVQALKASGNQIEKIVDTASLGTFEPRRQVQDHPPRPHYT